TSGKLDYLIDESLTQFRGGVVELRNQRDNVLRTYILDYNTQDSLAIFSGGAAMISADGQIIESDEGTYENGRGTYDFSGNVNMFTDSVFVRTDHLLYDSNTDRADFLTDIDFWRDGRMLSAGSGWYERRDDTFFLRDQVHGLGASEESWSDSLYYYRGPNDLLMLGSVQVQDQSRRVAAMGDRMQYVDSLARVTLEENASVALWDEEGAQADTTYLGAERFIYWTLPKCDVDGNEISLAEKRRTEMLQDPIAAYRQRAAEEAAQKRDEALKNDPVAADRAAAMARGKGPGNSTLVSSGDESPELPASLSSEIDSSSFAGSTGESPDSLAVPAPDSTKIGFLLANKDIRIFRKDMQVRCDSLRYSDLDSIARLYKNPIVWNEGNRQYNSDSLFVLLRNEKMERANLLSNAFVHTEEAGGYFDQIKSTDIIAYFSDSTSLRRFDALGGVTALLYLEEDETIATVNRTESKMMMATFDAEGNVDHVFNFDSPKSDAFPVVQLPASEHRLRGFNWQPELRPKDKYDVTAMVVRDSEREFYEARPHAEFHQTDRYFPGHMAELYASLDSAKTRRNTRGASTVKPANEDEAVHDTLSVALRDTLSVAASDSSSVAASDSSSVAVRDSTVILSEAKNLPTPTDTTYMSPRELKRALRIAKRDARWERLDQRDADKAAAKEARKAARKAKREAREAAHAARQAEIDAAKLQKYIERYQKKKARDEARKQKPVPSGERTPGVEAGGELPTSPESE
ncbi:MAG: hypothetical protein J6W83_05570, partial [Bacteroidales bacterium]|nr:hypothetical protein [Bacteroidales bacterium]